jgi:adenylosuccinate synthase
MMKPAYLELPGWDKDIAGIQDIKKLPKNARKFIAEVQNRIGAPVIGVGTGPRPEDMIWIE